MISKKNRKNPVYMEARKVLLNQVDLDEDGHFVASDDTRIQLWGAADGENKIRAVGLSVKHFPFISNFSNREAINKTKTDMAMIGRGINIKSLDHSAATLVRSYVFYPVVLVFTENEENELELTTYTPRAVSSPIAVWLAVRRFDKSTEGVLKRVESEREISFKNGFKDFKKKLKRKKSEEEDLYYDVEPGKDDK